MAVTGCLSDFSLSELFKLLGQGRRTGLLTVCEQISSASGTEGRVSGASLDSWRAASAEQSSAERGGSGQGGSGRDSSEQGGPNDETDEKLRHLIWFYEGRIVAYVSRRGKTLSSLGDRLTKLKEPGERAIKKMQMVRPPALPLGQWLQSQGVLQSEQLQLLFREQVIHPIAKLLMVPDGAFCFQRQLRLPLTEMTGLSIQPGAVTLAGLRKMEDWPHWKMELPDMKTTAVSRSGSPAGLKLTPLEWEVWEAADGRRTLLSLERQLKQPLVEIQQVAFRLNRAGLLDWCETALWGGSGTSHLKSNFRRPRLPSVLAQVIDRVEGRSPLAVPLTLAETHSDSAIPFSTSETAAEPSTPEP